MYAILIALLSTTAHASDGKILPGASCQPESSTYASNLRISNGRIYNNSEASDIYVTCPVINDADGDIDYAVINVYDQNSSDAISCQLLSYDMATGGTSCADDSDSSSSGYDTLDIGSVGCGEADYYQIIRCKLPEKTSTGKVSYLIGYEVSEDT